ncbi:T9SS type A sorting domain-containing protein [Adhaeribacter soli]|uniref:T9SS type A sorting domain-containing protein n=1 Tax=Adhaeribacter soli TaxID=2607655 RepID=A0A5N1J5W4_9BACT|nr:T9SS type A sorting domain-containing protein [Adhaeribacter soli]KAA9340092.1 T9SS type A sorting domain-containing protein [Adhaeribacter soli]
MKKTLSILLTAIVAVSTAQAQWVSQNSPNLPNTMLYEVEAVDANVTWAASPFMEVVKTTDGGLTWKSYPVVDPVFTSASITSVTALNANTAWIVVAEMGQTNFSRIYRTTDGGTTWQHQPTAYTNPGSYGEYIHFFDPNNGLAIGFASAPGNTTKTEILTTSDGGTTWSQVPAANMPAAPSADVLYNTLATVGNTVWVMDFDFNILKSVDKGLTWTSASSGLTFSNLEGSLAFTDANNGLAGLNGQLRRTTDGGATWMTVTPTGPFFPFRIIAIPGTSSYISSNRDRNNPGSSISHDHGNTWILLENTMSHLDMEFADATTGYSAGFAVMRKFGSNISGIKKELSMAGSYAIFPNPSPGTLQVLPASDKPYTIEVYDVTGNRINRQTGNRFGKTQLDLGKEKKGIYMLHIITGNQRFVKKVVLQ